MDRRVKWVGPRESRSAGNVCVGRLPTQNYLFADALTAFRSNEWLSAALYSEARRDVQSIHFCRIKGVSERVGFIFNEWSRQVKQLGELVRVTTHRMCNTEVADCSLEL